VFSVRQDLDNSIICMNSGFFKGYVVYVVDANSKFTPEQATKT